MQATEAPLVLEASQQAQRPAPCSPSMPHPASCVDYGALGTAMAARVTWPTKKLGAATSGKQTSDGELRFGRWLLVHIERRHRAFGDWAALCRPPIDTTTLA